MEHKNLKSILDLIDNDIINNENNFNSNPKQYIEYFHTLYYNIFQGKSIVDIANKFNHKLFVNSATNVILNQMIDILVDGKVRDFRGFMLLNNIKMKEHSSKESEYDSNNGVLFNIGNGKLDKFTFSPYYKNEFKRLLKILGSKDFAFFLLIVYNKTELYNILER